MPHTTPSGSSEALVAVCGCTVTFVPVGFREEPALMNGAASARSKFLAAPCACAAAALAGGDKAVAGLGMPS